MNSIAKFFKKEKRKLLGYIKKKVMEFAYLEPEDILQDVFVNLIAHPFPENSIDNIEQYVFKSLKHRIIDIYRKKARDAKIHVPFDEEVLNSLRDNHANVDRDAENQYLSQILSEKVALLPKKQQAVWIASEIENIPLTELAKQWDEPLGTLLSRKSRANSRLRELLSKEYDEISNGN